MLNGERDHTHLIASIDALAEKAENYLRWMIDSTDTDGKPMFRVKIRGVPTYFKVDNHVPIAKSDKN